jgi:hypothetical protein
MIKNNPKLRNYQKKLEQELYRFITCFCLAPTGIFALEDNKKDLVIAAIEGLPIAGYFLKILTIGLSYANQQHKIYQYNRLTQLFEDDKMIAPVCHILSRKLAISRAILIEEQTVEIHEGLSKVRSYFYEKVKALVNEQVHDLRTGNAIGIKLRPEEKLAVLDVAYLLEKILSGKEKIKAEDLQAADAKKEGRIPFLVGAFSDIIRGGKIITHNLFAESQGLGELENDLVKNLQDYIAKRSKEGLATIGYQTSELKRRIRFVQDVQYALEHQDSRRFLGYINNNEIVTVQTPFRLNNPTNFIA